MVDLTQRFLAWTRRHASGLNAWLVVPWGLMSTLAVYYTLGLDPSYRPAPGPPGEIQRVAFGVALIGFIAVVAAALLRVNRINTAFWLGGIGGLFIAPSLMDSPVSLLGSPMILAVLYSSAARGSRLVRRSGLVLVFVAPVFTGASTAIRLYLDSTPMGFGILIFLCSFLFLLLLVTWVLGDIARHRRLTLQLAQERAERLEREAIQERALAAKDERARIAREMHDIVAHSLAVIVTQADGGRYAAAAEPQAATRTLETVAQTARRSLAEMRGLLGVLRTDEGTAYDAAPGIDRIPELVDAAQRSGLDANYRLSQLISRDRLPHGAELVLYRAAQEMLTNALKHAGRGSSAYLQLSEERGRIFLTCNSLRASTSPYSEQSGTPLPPLPLYTDPALQDRSRPIGEREEPGAASARGHKLGLRGMEERVRLYGGSLRAEPTEAGFRTAVVVPLGEKNPAPQLPQRRTP